MTTEIRILLVEPYAIVRSGLRAIFAHEPDLLVVGEAVRGGEVLRQMNRHFPDVVLMDLKLPETDSLELICRIRHSHPQCQVVVLTECTEDRQIRGAIQAGALGYLLKDVQPAELVRSLRAAAQGEPTLHPEAQRTLMRQTLGAETPMTVLTQREMDVLRLITQGKRNKEIAATLYLTEGTVKGYISTIFEKLCVQDRTQAALYAVKHQLVMEA